MVQLFGFLRDKFAMQVPLGPSPRDFIPKLPVSDIAEFNEDFEPAGTSVSGITIIIAYTDAKGAASLRQISCIRMEIGKGRRYLRAFCHHRRAQRMFLVDRIETIHDAETGEELASGTTYFAQFDDDRISQSAPGWGLSPVQRADLGAGLTSLVFLSRCDGHVDPVETDEIDTFTASWWIRAEIRAPLPEAEIAAHVRRLAPDVEAFVLSTQRIRASATLRPLVAGYAKRVIEADGRIAPEEHHWIGRYIGWINSEEISDRY